MFHPQLGHFLVASTVAGIMGLSGYFITPFSTIPTTSLTLAASESVVESGAVVTVPVTVHADQPVNVFSGLITFDPNILAVQSIEYNTSFANLWAEAPWFKNGEGTIGFVGGTTRPGGFTGSDTLLTVTFVTVQNGKSVLHLEDVKILYHDGLGTNAPLTEPLDVFITVTSEQPSLIDRSPTTPTKKVTIQATAISTDLNGDGTTNFLDLSIFMTHLATQNLRSDFTGDGRVTIADSSILLEAI